MKHTFSIVVIFALMIVLSACVDPQMDTGPSTISLPYTTSSVPSTTAPQVPDPSKYDCFSIPEEVMTQIAPLCFDTKKEKVETVIKIRTSSFRGEPHTSFYNFYIYDLINYIPINEDLRFPVPGKIEDILQAELRTDDVYMFVCESNLVTFANSNVELFLDKDFYGQHAFWGRFYEYAVAPEKVLSEDVVVYNVLCMREHNNTGAFIGYITNKGEFLLYGNSETGKLYLIPMENYYDIIYSGMSKWGEPPENVCDITSYEVSLGT